nr:PAS domain S-box protein [Clostridia bacterium]
LYVYIQDKNLINRSFLIMTASAAVWQAGIGMMYVMKDTELILSFYRVFIFLGVVNIAPGIYFFTVTSLGLFEKKKKHVFANYVIAFVFYFVSLVTDWLAHGVVEHFWGRYVTYGPLSYPFLFFFAVLIVRSLQLYQKTISQMEPGIKRDQLNLFRLSLSFAVIGSVDFLSCFPPIRVYPFGFGPVLVFVSLQTYAILRYKKASLITIFGSLEDGILVVDRYNRIVEVNPSFEKMMKIVRSDLIGKDVLDAFSLISDKNEDHATVQSIIRMITMNPAQIFKEDIAFKESRMFLSVTSSMIMDRFGTRTGSVIVFRDITERKKAEEELERYKDELEVLVQARTEELTKSEAKYKALVDHAQVGIGIHQNFRMVFANRQFLSMLGYEEEELLTLPISQLIHPDEIKTVLSRASDRYNGQEVIETYEIRLLRKDGSVMPSIISNVVIEYEGRTATLITVVDTTETKLRKELEQVNQEIEMFTYSVSHDLRAPLRSIDGFSQALLEDYADQLDTEGQDCLWRIRAACQRMSILIDAILKLSRIGRSELKREMINMSELVRDIAKELKTTNPDRRVEFIIESDIIAVGDPTYLRTALENLIGNAFKFTKNCDHARIEFGSLHQDKKTVYYVRDNGVGFDMKYMDKIFTPFQRLHGSEEFEGTGIGLTSVQRIIQRHGGRVWAESAVNQGATFYFTLE